MYLKGKGKIRDYLLFLFTILHLFVSVLSFHPSVIRRYRKKGNLYLEGTSFTDQRKNVAIKRPQDRYVDIADIPVWEVPKELRREIIDDSKKEEPIITLESKEESHPYLRYYSLEDLFFDCDGKKLAILFDENEEFRFDTNRDERRFIYSRRYKVGKSQQLHQRYELVLAC